ncbi:hypothetical protein FEM48_Zijuj04G0057100 [Ziziphus jujuba var. spinosa]|uniref:Peptidase metallopeptidase domain-containing protein n=1 Tax=Ziziphus jujuba var. spinosa TaxID=714518 RepID=A0A978VI49_ZIZJJ|nr:hypothetical protein FEM48_Zijuj04G0057100 [Ziziphus jujuba var. spinosa]
MAANTIFISSSLMAFVLFLLVQQLPLVVLSRSLRHKNPQSFNTLLSTLEGLSKGQTHENLHHLRLYLQRLGYLNYNSETTTLNKDYFDDVLESAVKLYQRNYHLKITGKLDIDTLNEAAKARCGVPDTGLRFKSISNNNNGEHHHTNISANDDFLLNINEGSLYSFFDGNPKWPSDKTHLNYTFNSVVEPIPQEDLRAASSAAFAEWAFHSKFTFEELLQVDVPSDIKIGYFFGDHGDGRPFDGTGNLLGHAFAPTDGRLHLDAEDFITFNPPGPDQYDLISLILHEIGHLLGLLHSSDPNAVMFSSLQAGITRRFLTEDDIAGIQALYAEQ